METKNLSKYKWAFLGSPQIAAYFLEELHTRYHVFPDLIVCNPDKPTGRKQTLTPPETKIFAEKHSIPYIQTTDLDDYAESLQGYDFFCVFAYGSILKQRHLDLPKYGCVNIHPSLLPKYRGPSPITSAILDDEKNTGLTLMKLDAGMDSGPLIAQVTVSVDEWEKYSVHEQEMAHRGAELFFGCIDAYCQNILPHQVQDAEQASYCPKYNKQDMEIDLNSSPLEQYLTYCAFEKPFFIRGKRYVVTEANYDAEKNIFAILRVIPEGKKERIFNSDDLALDKK